MGLRSGQTNSGSFKKGSIPPEHKESCSCPRCAGFSKNYEKGHIPWNKGKIWLERRGKKHHNWKGGLARKKRKIKTSREYMDWRLAIFKRDNYTCVLCDAKNKKGIRIKLHADHIKQFAYYPELRFVVSNGRTLCEDCHRKTKTYGKVTDN